MIGTQQVGNFRLAPCSSSKNGLPSAIQGAVFCLANIFVQASVNGFGETAIAGSTLPMLYHAFPLSWVATILLVNAWFLAAKCAEKSKPRSAKTAGK